MAIRWDLASSDSSYPVCFSPAAWGLSLNCPQITRSTPCILLCFSYQFILFFLWVLSRIWVGLVTMLSLLISGVLALRDVVLWFKWDRVIRRTVLLASFLWRKRTWALQCGFQSYSGLGVCPDVLREDECQGPSCLSLPSSISTSPSSPLHTPRHLFLLLHQICFSSSLFPHCFSSYHMSNIETQNYNHIGP